MLVGVQVDVGDGVLVGVGLEVGLGVGEGEGEGVSVRLGSGVGESVGVSVGVAGGAMATDISEESGVGVSGGGDDPHNQNPIPTKMVRMTRPAPTIVIIFGRKPDGGETGVGAGVGACCSEGTVIKPRTAAAATRVSRRVVVSSSLNFNAPNSIMTRPR